MRKWTAEERQRQRELIQRWRPWEKSTGAKTPEGKRISSKNATKNGNSVQTRKIIKLLNQFLRIHKDLIK